MIESILGGRYSMVRLVGEGAMGAVYEARHATTGRRVAVKLITADLTKHPRLVSRFEVEAKAAGRVESQYIAQVLDAGTDESLGAPYLVMEFLVGEDLQHAIDRLGALRVDAALRIAAHAALGLEKAHAASILHRDIKPANIYLAERDSDEVVAKLLDFGVAKIRAEDEQAASLTRTGTLLGSPLYMSPEQARGAKVIDHRSDIWSLGIVLYQMLAGRTPYHHIEALGELIITICAAPPPSVRRFAPWVPADVARVVEKALAVVPEQRYQDGGEMYRALKALLPGGHALERSMIAAVSDAERATPAVDVAPQAPPASPSSSISEGVPLAASAPGSSQPPPREAGSVAPAPIVAVPLPVQATSTAGLSLGTSVLPPEAGRPSMPAAPPARLRLPLVLAGGAAVAVAGVLITMKLVSGQPAGARGTAASDVSGAPDRPVASVVASAAESAQPAPVVEPSPTGAASGPAPAASASSSAEAAPSASAKAPPTKAKGPLPSMKKSVQSRLGL